MSSFAKLERVFERSAALLALIGGSGLIFATLVTCVSIVLKLVSRAINAALGPQVMLEHAPWLRPILGEEELVTYGVGLALFAALPWVMIRRGHIRIDLLEGLFGHGVNKLLDVIADVTLMVLAYLVMTRQWGLLFKTTRGNKADEFDLLLGGDWAGVIGKMRLTENSQILGIPLWPTYIAAEICVAAFFIVALFCVLRSTRALFIH